ncbi:MAG TPA: hypothetical protein DHM37_00125 [Candidatus Cloacimonas sp.]|nr:hypothetical protein [Candidatus Cloacimonas sp.]
MPHSYYHAKTGQAGSCRACVMELEDIAGLKNSCTIEFQADIKVNFHTAKIKESQRVIAI